MTTFAAETAPHFFMLELITSNQHHIFEVMSHSARNGPATRGIFQTAQHLGAFWGRGQRQVEASELEKDGHEGHSDEGPWGDCQKYVC